MSDLQDQVAVVVGSSSGMGRATAIGLADRGAKVVLAARRRDKLEELASEIGTNTLVCVVDVEDTEQVEALIRSTLDAFGRIDILVYATGTNIPE
ncbi:MAG: SDR family NAD(P)-dependent oxidoreductase, partial [Gemmatimonadetes bacterium]|nr:SDR family NAD(P)-dependent oxidoreductase [Gemmatimonadota bacterium]